MSDTCAREAGRRCTSPTSHSKRLLHQPRDLYELQHTVRDGRNATPAREGGSSRLTNGGEKLRC